MAQWDRIEVDGSPMRLYVEMPSIGRTFAAVIVVHHGGGVDRFIEDRVENLARHGYLAIAPDLYHRPPSSPGLRSRLGFRQPQSDPEEETPMLSWAIAFLLIALVAGLLGFTAIFGAAVGIAKILFFVFLVLFVIALVTGRRVVP